MRRDGSWLVGLPIVALSVLFSGCALGSRNEDRLYAEVQIANARAAESDAKVAALAARLERIEDRGDASAHTASVAARDARVVERLDELIALNHELLARQARPVAPETPPSPASAARSATGCDDGGLPPEERLRRLVVELHGNTSGFRGGLSRQQAEALHILLRRERVLDDANPWQTWH